MSDFDKINPYAPSGAVYRKPDEQGETLQPAYRLFTPWSVAVAAFLGSVLGGAIVVAINYLRVGQRRNALVAVVGGFIALVLVVALLWVLPVHIPSLAASALQAWAMHGIAQSTQGELLKQHYRRFGRAASSWAAAGIGCLTAIVLVVVLAAVLVAVAFFGGEDVQDVFRDL